jgi:GTP cyclohydrolase I
MSEEVKLNTNCDCSCDDPTLCMQEATNLLNLNPRNQLVSERIRNRLVCSGVEFRANQNISNYIQEGELELLVDEVADRMQLVLESLVIDTENDWNTQGTARRVAKMMINEIYRGRYYPAPDITTFPNHAYQSLYVSEGITIRSQCSHHLQNISGTCWVGVFPEEEVIGLSKFNRIVDWIASRPQIQEEMTSRIAEDLAKFARTPNVAVIIKAAHACMSMRGVRESCGSMSTAVMMGKFKTDQALKEEFYDLIQLKIK